MTEIRTNHIYTTHTQQTLLSVFGWISVPAPCMIPAKKFKYYNFFIFKITLPFTRYIHAAKQLFFVLSATRGKMETVMC